MATAMRTLIALLLLVSCSVTSAARVVVSSVRAVSNPERTRVVFDVNGPLEHTLFMLKNPDRVVVDLRATRVATRMPKPPPGDRFLAGMRSGSRPDGGLRVVFDLKGAARPRSFLLKPDGKLGHRLVVDLFRDSKPVRRDKSTLR